VRNIWTIARQKGDRTVVHLISLLGSSDPHWRDVEADRAEQPRPGLQFGRPTGSANPLAWTCAQFIRLALAQRDGHLPETPEVVLRHFEDLAGSHRSP